MKLKLSSAIRAFPILALETYEPLRAIRELHEQLNGDADVLIWDLLGGVQPFSKWNRAPDPREGNPAGKKLSPPLGPVAALHEVPAGQPTVMVAINYNRALRSEHQVAVIQALLDGCRIWASDTRRLVLVCPPGTEYPPEIVRYIHVYDHELPAVEDLAQIVRANIEAQEALVTQRAEAGKLSKAEARKARQKLQLAADDVQAVAQMGRGLTSFEFANAVAVSMAEYGEVRLAVIASEKEQVLRQSEILEWARSDWTFDDIGGLDEVKEFLLATVGRPLTRGVLFLGVPGVGKSMLAFALGNERRLPAFVLSLTAAATSAYGGTEQRVIRALKTINAMGRCIVILDEIEKMLAGVSKDAYVGDSGTTKRSGGEVLKWLSDPNREAYPVATCNDLDSLDAEYTRTGRWDAIFFFDIPTQQERDIIAGIYAEKYGIALDPRPDEHGWTGAEIEAAYRLAHVFGDPDTTRSRRFITPLYATQREKIEALREWAQGRASWASVRGEGSAEALEVVRAVM